MPHLSVLMEVKDNYGICPVIQIRLSSYLADTSAFQQVSYKLGQWLFCNSVTNNLDVFHVFSLS